MHRLLFFLLARTPQLLQKSNMIAPILIVDDEADIRMLVADILEDNQYNTVAAANSEQVQEVLQHTLPSAVILDIWLKDSALDGLGILEFLSRKYPTIPVIMASGHGTIETAIKSLKLGAFDYLEKPFSEEKLLHLLKHALEHRRLNEEVSALRAKHSAGAWLGKSAPMQRVKQQVQQFSKSNTRLFLHGGSGVGKSQLAEMIHYDSLRNHHPFIALDARSLSEKDASRILFGQEDEQHMSGPARMVGALEQAAGGTLFIDEISALPETAHAALARFLASGTFTREHGTQEIEADVRIISASRHSPEALKDMLGQTLIDRLLVETITLPALSERLEDIPLLAEHFLERFCTSYHCPAKTLSDDAIMHLQHIAWPGNIRQLRHSMEWVVLHHPLATEITAAELPIEISQPEQRNTSEAEENADDTAPQFNTENSTMLSLPLKEARRAFESHYLDAQMRRFNGNITQTAQFIGMERAALHRKIKQVAS